MAAGCVGIARGSTNSAVQRYKVSSPFDDGWQRGTADGPVHPTFSGQFTDSLYYASAVDCRDVPPPTDTYVYLCGESYVFSVAYRFTNVQLDQFATVTDVRLKLWLSNAHTEGQVNEFIADVAVQDSGDCSDLRTAPDFVHRPMTDDIEWDSFVGQDGLSFAGNYASSPNLAPIVQTMVNRPDRERGDAVCVFVKGEIYRQADYSRWLKAYDWEAQGFSAPGDHQARLDVQTP